MAPKKTLDELAKQVADTQAGLMSVEDIRVLFEGDPQIDQLTQQTPTEPVVANTPASAEPVTPVTPVVPVAPTPPMPPTPRPGQKSVEELELELQKAKQDKDEALRLYNSMLVAPVQEPSRQTAPVEPIEDDDDDTTFFEKPSAMSRKIARQELAQGIAAYHKALVDSQTKVKFVEDFKASHPDFETYREDMSYVLRARPDLDKNYASLPMVYEMAKQRYKIRLDKMRADLGITEPTPQVTTPAAPVTPQVDEAALIEKVKNVIAEELRRRKAAAGITGGTTPVSPSTRTEPVVRTTPQTPEEVIFDEMLRSGPKRLELESDGIKAVPR